MSTAHRDAPCLAEVQWPLHSSIIEGRQAIIATLPLAPAPRMFGRINAQLSGSLPSQSKPSSSSCCILSADSMRERFAMRCTLHLHTTM